jgi:putative PEP-CTERM system histidine kinase
MTTPQFLLGTVGFGAAAIAYAIVALLVIRTSIGTRPANYFVLALIATAAWAAAYAWATWSAVGIAPGLVVADALHTASLALFLTAVLSDSVPGPLGQRVARIIVAATIFLAGLCMLGAFGLAGVALRSPSTSVLAALALPLLGLLALEQIYRNSDVQSRNALKPLSLGIALVLGADVLVYSYAVVFGTIQVDLALLRGVFNVLAAPAFALAARRQLKWKSDFYVSRQVVFYTTGLIGAGLYFLAMAVTAFFVASSGASWGPIVQIALVCAIGIALTYIFFSATLRRRIKVFISKNFYRDRYDYRKEWLRLIETLVGRSEDAPLRVRAVKALAEIVGSAGGELWLRGAEGGDYQGHGSWGRPTPAAPIRHDDELADYLEKSHWVVDTLEYTKNPGLYVHAFAADAPFLHPASIYVPIIHKNRLIGIVRLDRPAGLGDLSYEDHDLLKTAGQQVAVFLVQERAQEELFETRQFEAFSKLTAFLMHDLKNMIAQQDLVVANARRFKHRPEFIDDAISTIASSVERMRKILERLQGATRVEKASRIELSELLRDICKDCSDRQPRPTLLSDTSMLYAEMDRDRLNMAVTHLIRNSQDATPASGAIEVRLSQQERVAIIEVIDTGCGMDLDFIRNRLFRPFDSTKGAQGMGIGAYQIRETLKAVGGSVEVDSELGHGTTMRIKLPLSASPGSVPRQLAS